MNFFGKVFFLKTAWSYTYRRIVAFKHMIILCVVFADKNSTTFWAKVYNKYFAAIRICTGSCIVNTERVRG